MPGRGRHQSTSKECRRVLTRMEALPGVKAVILGHSYGGKSLGRHGSTGQVRIQREMEGGWKGVIQSSRGLQELFVLLVDEADRERVARLLEEEGLWEGNER